MLINFRGKFFIPFFLFLSLLIFPHLVSAVTVPGDLDGDCDVDKLDLNILLQDRGKPVSQSACGSACDLDGDGVITILDARKLVLLCTKPLCEVLASTCEQPPACTEGETRPCSTACGVGVEICVNGQWQACNAPQPQPEICDGIDNDCDGQIDEGFDADFDGVADCFDKCPNDPENDLDGDGVCGDVDQCPGTPPGEQVNVAGCSARQLNRPPTLDAPQSLTVAEGSTLTFSINASDPDGDQLTLSAQGLPQGATFNPVTGTFSWTPGFQQSGSYTVVFSVRDSFVSVERQTEINVIEINRPPSIITTSIPNGRIDQLYNVKIEAADPDGDSLLFKLLEAPDGMTIDPSQGTISWRPQVSQIGNWFLTVNVNDNRGGEDTKRYQLAVPDTIPPSVFLNVPSKSFPGATFKATITAKDNVGISRVILTVEGQEPLEFTSEPYESNITLSSILAPGSTVNVKAKAFDTSDNTAETVLRINIVGVPDTTPPAAKLNAPPQVTPGTTILLSATVQDDTGIDKVIFYVNGEVVGSASVTEPVIEYHVPHDLPPDSAPKITVEVTDFSGNKSQDEGTAQVSDQPDTTPPQMSLNVPDTVEENKKIEIQPQISDDTNVSKIEVYVDHKLVNILTEIPDGPIDVALPEHVKPGMDVLVEVVVTDSSGNETRQTKMVSVEQPGQGMIRGEVFDDSTGVPIKDAEVTITAADGSIITTVTDHKGRYSAILKTGEALISVKKTGYTEVLRPHVSVEKGTITKVFDARITPLKPPQRVSSVIGKTLSLPFDLFRGGYIPVLKGKGIEPDRVPPQNINLQIPGGSLSGDMDIIFTQISPQGLRALLPPGWSPLGVVNILPENTAFNTPATLTIPNILGFSEDSGVILVFYDREKNAWISKGNPIINNTEIRGEISSGGQYAFLVPDITPARPPAPQLGEVLQGVSKGTLPETVTTILSPSPKIIFYSPGVYSQVGLTVTPETEPLSSGVPVETIISEEYNFFSGSKINLSPYNEDIVLYSFTRFPLTASYPVTPSMEFEPLSLKKGIITVDVTAPSVKGLNLIGPDGGTIALPSGEEIQIPAGAFAYFVPVNIERITLNDLGIPLPDGVEFINALNIDLTGNVPSKSFILSVPLPQGLSEGQFLILRVSEVLGATRHVLTGIGSIQNGRIVSFQSLSQGDVTVAFPGINMEGRYVLVKAAKPVGFSGGRVIGVTGDTLSDALVTANTTEIISLSREDGTYASVLPVGLFNLTAINRVTLDKGSQVGEIPSMGALLSLDISLQKEPPVVISVEPQDGSKNVPLETAVKILFSEPIDSLTATAENLLLKGPEGSITGSIELRDSNRMVIFRPLRPLSPDTSYTFTINTGIKDLAGYNLEQPYSFTFMSLDTMPPPPPPAGNLNATIPGDDGKTTVTGTQGSAGVHDTVTIINKTKNLSVPALVNPDGSFSAIINAGIRDEIIISIKDPAGNETVVPIGRFKNPDGSVVIGPEGGEIELANGVVINIPEGAFPDGAVVKATPLQESDIPVSPGPDFPFVAAFEIKNSVYPQRYFNVSAPIPSGMAGGANSGIVTKVVNIYGGEPRLAVVDTAKVEEGLLITSSPPCPGVRDLYAKYALYLNRISLMAQLQATVFFTALGGGPLGFASYMGGLGIGAALAAIEILNTNLESLYPPFTAVPEGGNPYSCMLVPPETELKAVIRDPETREVIDYIDIDPIEPFGHAHFDFSVYKKDDVYGPELVGIEPANKILTPHNRRITIRFSEPIDHIYLLGKGIKDIYLTPEGNESVYYTGRWELQENNTVLVFELHRQLPLGENFVLHLENIRDLAGNSYLGKNIEIRTFKPNIIFPTQGSQLNKAKVAQDLGVSIDEIPRDFSIHDLDYSTRGPERSHDGRWHTDIAALYSPQGWSTYRLFKIDATDPTRPYVSGAFQTRAGYEQWGIRLLDDVPIPPREDFWGQPWWKRKELVYNIQNPSVKLCWDPESSQDQERHNQWIERHCRSGGCETDTRGCGDLAVVTGDGREASGASRSQLFIYEAGAPDSPEGISWIGWRYLSDDGYGYSILPEAPVGIGYPLGLTLIPHMGITHGATTHSDTIGAFVANRGIGLQLVDIGLNMPGISDAERKDETKPWASIERLQLVKGSSSNYTDVGFAPSRVRDDGLQIPPRIVALVTDGRSIKNLEIFTLGSSSPTGTKALSRIPEHLAIATNIPVENYETGEVRYRDLAIITTAKDTGGGILIYEIPDDGSSPAQGQYIEIPVGTKFIDVDSKAQFAYVGASGGDGETDQLLIIDISDPFVYVGDNDKDGWNDRVIARVPLNFPGYTGPVYSRGLKVDPERGLVYMGIYAGGDQGLMIIKVNDCPNPGVDFKELRKAYTIPEDVLKKGIEQVIGYALSGAGLQDEVSVVAFGDGACLWRGGCPLNTADLKYRFAVLIPESQWNKKDLFINTLMAQVKDETTGESKKVFLEGSDVYAVYEDIEFIPFKLNEFIMANIGLDFNEMDFGLARQSLLLEILLTGTYVDTIPHVRRSQVPLKVILSNLSTSCSADECGTVEPSHIWRQEGYEMLKLGLARFYRDGLLIRIMNEAEKGTSLHRRWKDDIKEAARLALQAVLARMITTEEGNFFLASRADTYGMADSGVIVSSSADPNQWEFTAGLKNFEHWIATIAALSVKNNIGVFAPDEIVRDVFDFIVVFNGNKTIAGEEEANAFIAKCYKYIEQELIGISWSVYQAKLMDDPGASQRRSNMDAVEAKIQEYRTDGKKKLIPRFFSHGPGKGLSIPVKMYVFKGGSWEETVSKEIDLTSGSEKTLPADTFKLTGIDQLNPSSSGWAGITIDIEFLDASQWKLPVRKMRDGDRRNNLYRLYYYVIDPNNPSSVQEPPLVPIFPDPDGTLFTPEPECGCNEPEIRLGLDINGLDHVEMNLGDCVNLHVTVENTGCRPLENVTIYSNLVRSPGAEPLSTPVGKIGAGEKKDIFMPYCLIRTEERYIEGYVWFGEDDPNYDPVSYESEPVKIFIPTGRLHVDGRAEGKDEVIVKKGADVNFSLDLSSLDLSGCSSTAVIWDMADGSAPISGATELTHRFEKGGTFRTTVTVRCDNREEMDRIPVHVVDMAIHINETEDEEDDLVMLRSSLPDHEPVQGVEVIPAKIILSKPLNTPIYVKLEEVTGDHVGFKEQGGQKTLYIPSGETTARFEIAGYAGSNTKNDVHIKATVIGSGVGTPVTEISIEEDMTVFWFDKDQSYVNVYIPKDSEGNPLGKYNFTMGVFQADPYAVAIKAWAKIKPEGLNCNTEVLKDLRIGIVQNVIESTDVFNKKFTNLVWDPSVPSGTMVFVPENIEASVRLKNLVDSAGIRFPLYDVSYLGETYLQSLECQDPGEYARKEALATDNPGSKDFIVKKYPVKDQNGNVVGEAVYYFINASIKTEFRVWAVIYDALGQEVIETISETSWSLDVDSSRTGDQMASPIGSYSAPTSIPVLRGPTANFCLNNATDTSCQGKALEEVKLYNLGAVIKP